MGHARQLRLFIYARIIVTFLFLVFTVALILKEPEAIDELSTNGVVRLMAFSFLFSVISFLLSKKTRFQFFITYLQTIWDLLFVTVLLLFTGGVTSPYSFLYLLSIMNAGVLLGRREAFYTASLCGILYGTIIDFQYFGFLEHIGLNQVAAQQLGAMHILYNIFMNLVGFYLTCFLTGYLSELAKQNADALVKKSVNYDELERLHSTIVANVESGLVTVTRDGNIRVFNPYAEVLTEKSQSDVYDLPLNTVFPAMAEALGDLSRGANGEFSWSIPNKPSLILGYSTVPFMDAHGDQVGAIINFKDLTVKKQMEETLKRSDKLAVLGELAARMAHEIRNPLAAMSGSVQLLADHGTIAENDQRLLTIILRETERLNSLITNFLTYARPVAPHKERLDLHSFVEDIRMLTSSDRRFTGITLTNRVPEEMVIRADANQMRQVLINLLNNAAEAIQETGVISIGAHYAQEATPLHAREEYAVITVSDTGSGIPKEAVAHLFEPFWTTKNAGTGLGLAITYRIIEEHGGTIRAESPSDGGCCITITLPK
ncbi:MAG: PAS domain-containing sensor histidine kinase [Desulfuromonadales bacterium]|nr:PAS domain-containing sensor histidine kinase [Desulfuromonadales bacterium]